MLKFIAAAATALVLMFASAAAAEDNGRDVPNRDIVLAIRSLEARVSALEAENQALKRNVVVQARWNQTVTDGLIGFDKQLKGFKQYVAADVNFNRVMAVDILPILSWQNESARQVFVREIAPKIDRSFADAAAKLK